MTDEWPVPKVLESKDIQTDKIVEKEPIQQTTTEVQTNRFETKDTDAGQTHIAVMSLDTNISPCFILPPPIVEKKE